MIAENHNSPLNRQSLLSTLWIFVLFNVAFRDIHEFFRVGFVEEIMTGTVNGVELTEEMMLIAGVMMEIPIVMILLAQILPYRANRWANIVGGLIGVGFVFITARHDLDDLFFAAIQLSTAIAIIWLAWTWSEPRGIGGSR